MPQNTASAAAIFDVDGTLCATRSSASLIWLRARQHAPWRHRLWLASLLWRAPLAYLADCISRDLADRMVFAQFVGLSLQQARRDAERCSQELLLPACYPQALATLERHRKAGRRILLLSGGVELVLAPLAQALGAELLAQRLVDDGTHFTGAYRGYAMLDDKAQPRPANQAKSKAAALQAYAAATGIDLGESYAYGDSINDADMLALVGKPTAINPDRRLAAIAARKGWAVQSWAGSASAESVLE